MHTSFLLNLELKFNKFNKEYHDFYLMEVFKRMVNVITPLALYYLEPMEEALQCK